ncbi:tRNA pseudouridine(38-40) synthase TruA [candidate division GN15 bacterium]|uniref:tRNA pseudouridine synthase A n=1 Tax=candidate division GN15 bacterium TaxID=2072418 RepID=A0A855XBB3_9BACT|nr:MAG: tRNA pseudouridine(38-40) synthase TruA [candidate division GN15 bacterium]
MIERNIKLTIEYKGTAFAGWQIQDGPRTVQAEVTEAIRKVTGETVDVVGAGRTDAGVHALGQVANFHITHSLEAGRFREALNYHLPDEIRVKDSREVPEAFHARFDAKYRRYRYLLAREKSAIYRELRWENPIEFDFARLQLAAAMVLGEHDFGPFCVTASLKEDNRCRIDYSRWYNVGPLWVYEIRGNRFLHSMVRSLVGGMVNLATIKADNNMHNLTLERFGSIIAAQCDERVVFTAPACGLYLVQVGY